MNEASSNIGPGDVVLPRPATTDLALPEHREFTVTAVAYKEGGRRVVFLDGSPAPLCESLGDRWIVVESRSN